MEPATRDIFLPDLFQHTRPHNVLVDEYPPNVSTLKLTALEKLDEQPIFEREPIEPNDTCTFYQPIRGYRQDEQGVLLV